MIQIPELPEPWQARKISTWVGQYSNQPEILRGLIERRCAYCSLGLMDGLRSDTLRVQLWDAGIRSIKREVVGSLEGMLIRSRANLGDGHKMILSAKVPWSEWPLVFAHELGHAWAPGTCGFDVDPYRSIPKEVACEAFAHLWLMQPGNLTRARRLLKPLRNGRSTLRIKEDSVV